MNTTQTLEQMRELKLTGMLHSYQSQLELSINHQLEAHELIAHLLEAENLHRTNTRLITLLHAAKLRFQAIPESIECSAARNLTKGQWSLLLECSFIGQGETVLITGSTGCGKTQVACALAYQACLLGIKTRYFNMNRFIDKIMLSKLDGSFTKLLRNVS